jgi:hypothetical protein
MKRRAKIIFTVVAGAIVLFLTFCAIAVWVSHKTVAHQSPYRWDAFVLPEQSFSNETIIEVVAKVNELVTQTSKGSVTQAVCLNTNPADIIEYSSDPAIKAEMVKLVGAYRKNETNWLNRGACGFETCRYTGKFMARHSLGCEFQELASWAQLDYEEKPDAIYLGRNPTHLECRAYKISPGLKLMAEDLKKQNQIRVDMNPVTSAFVDVSRVSFWIIDVPNKPNETTGEFRAASVFSYLPESSVLLVIETPEAQKLAEKNLKQAGIWESFLSHSQVWTRTPAKLWRIPQRFTLARQEKSATITSPISRNSRTTTP